MPAVTRDEMSDKTDVMLLCCGSFNPITYLHLSMFELARDYLNGTGRYHVVGGIISPVADGYQKQGLIAAKHRNAMVSLALETTDWIKLDTWESDQGVWLETAQVMQYHKEQLDSHTNYTDSSLTPSSNNNYRPVELYLLCGADLLESFHTPGQWTDEDIEAIVGRHGIVCKTRQGSDAQNVVQSSHLLQKHKDKMHIVEEWVINDISSTKIRAALERGGSVKYLLPDNVISYIHEHQLYGVADKKNGVC